METQSPERWESRWMAGLGQRVAMLALTARNICKEKDDLVWAVVSIFASQLDLLAFLLKEMQRDAELQYADYGRLQRGKQIEDEVAFMDVVFENYSGKGKLYLLSSCPHISREIQISRNRFAQALESLDSVLQKTGSSALKMRVAQVKEAFESASPQLHANQQALLDALDTEMLDIVVADPVRSTKLVEQIAESLEMPVDSENFAKELKKLKKDKENVENVKGKVYRLYLDQFESVLEKGLAVKRSPVVEPGFKMLSPVQDMSMRNMPFSPLQSFICPITRDVMRDPVQIASGMTYERAAIKRWFSEGHTRCPMGVELKNTKMKSNIALRQSIAEWRERNYDIRLQHAAENLLSDHDSFELEEAVQELQRICEEDNMNKYTITNKGMLIPLIRLTERQNFELRKATFATLRTLAEDNVENQDIMVSEGIIDTIIRGLAMRYDESEHAILLLRLLSANPVSAEKISRTHGAVLLLVTLLGSDHEETSNSVKVILENLPTSDDNIIIMAEANLMKPLLARLIDGSNSSKLKMAKTLAELPISEASKIQVATQESIGVLMSMTQSANEEEKEAAISALDNLSSVRDVCVLIAKEEIIGLQLLVPLITSMKASAVVKVGTARVMANIMMCLADHWEPSEKRDYQVDWLICIFIQLMNPFVSPVVHSHVLRGLVSLSKGLDTGPSARLLMKDQDALQLLVRFMKPDVDAEVRRHAVQLFASLSSSFGEEAAVALLKKPHSISNIVDILRRDFKNLVDAEQTFAVTILANLPVDDTTVTTALLQANSIPLLVNFLKSRHSSMEEAVAGALLRFTSPEFKDLQLKLAAEGVVQRLVSLLDSSSSLTKERAAKGLLNFSRSSLSLAKPITPRSWLTCFARLPNMCPIHFGDCKVESNFCLREADAVGSLMAVLREGEPGPCEAAIETLMTLVDDDLESHEPGCHLIADAKGIPVIINMLNTGTPKCKHWAILLLEKIMQVPRYTQEYGTQAQMHIITVVQKGTSSSKQVAGRILRQLDLLHSQSIYFGAGQSEMSHNYPSISIS